MGNVVSWFKSLFIKNTRILMLGLDAAGKTTILFKLKLGGTVTTIPTMGFNVETLEYKNLRLTMWDIGGQDNLRPLWKHHFKDTQGLIYVIDSEDRDRVRESKEELHKLLAEPELKDVCVLVFANKQDLPHAMTIAELTDFLDMDSLNHKWNIQSCCATNGDGLFAGLDWLGKAIYP